MVLMALDHTRGMVNGTSVDATDLDHTNAALFLTRWATHFCAPIFVFLAGTGAFLSLTRGKTRSELSRFLWTRGLWLIFLEFTLVRTGWSFRLGSPFVVGQVIWVLGCSMIILAGLVWLPTAVVTVFGIAMIGLHNLLDGLQAQSFGDFAPVWGILHGGYNLKLGHNFEFRPLYALVPWVGVMAAGYGFGSLFAIETKIRQRKLFWLGLGLSAAFVVIRAINIYGDPHPWSNQRSFLFTCFSFVNCTKYPPSLLFLLMTLGPGILLLARLDRVLNPSEHSQLDANEVMGGKGGERSSAILSMAARPFVVFGRVPLFYYLLHLPLIHFLAVVTAYPKYQLALGSFYFAHPPVDSGYGHELWVVYLVWIAAVLLLLPICSWFARVKQRRREAWLSYL